MTQLREKGYGAAGTCRVNSEVVQDLVDKKNTCRKLKMYSIEAVFFEEILCVSLMLFFLFSLISRQINES